MIQQTLPDYSFAPFEIQKEDRKNLNARYPYFRQNYYTAGDEGQFVDHWKSIPRGPTPFPASIPHHIPQLCLPFYQGTCLHDIYNTYRYLEKFKKGCFIQFRGGELVTFLPFSKQDFHNEWSSKIKIDPRFGTIYEMMRYLSQFDKAFPFDEKRIHKDITCWYGNNGLVRFEYPLNENDNGYNMLKDMFVVLSKERSIPDVDFFLNKRDMPVLKRDKTEAYDAFYGPSQPLLSHSYEKYVPILSMNTTDRHADIPIPTWDDWSRIAYTTEGKLFSKDFTTFSSPEELGSTPWDQKIPTVMFRGSSTGRGTTVENNIRLFFAKASLKEECDAKGNRILDCGITKWNLRPRMLNHETPLTTIYLDELGISLANYMTPLEQSRFKYILHLPGHVCAYRLSLEMFYGSVIFIYPSEEKLWFFDWMKPWVHYIPLEPTFSTDDLFQKLQWCKDHDDEAKMIGENARVFAMENLRRDGVLNHLESVLLLTSSLSKNAYGAKTLHQQQLENMSLILNRNLAFMDNGRPELIDLVLEGKMEDSLLLELEKSSLFFTEFFHTLHQRRQLVPFLRKYGKPFSNFRGRKNLFELFEWRGLSFFKKEILPSAKDDSVHQFFIGHMFLNSLQTEIPNFTKTYFLFDGENQTKNLILKYEPGKTLDHHIDSDSFCLDDLFQIWAALCLAIEQAQQFCGFIHMDLYPWNIVIQKKSVVTKYCFALDGKKTAVQWTGDVTPIMIDYGNSHVSHEGFHYYSTTPFHMNRFQDVFCLVVTSLDLYIKKKKLDGLEIRQILKVLNHIDPQQNILTLSQARSYLKGKKKFSNMLSNTINRDKRPFSLVQFMQQQGFVSSENIQVYTLSQPKYLPKIHFSHCHDASLFLFIERLNYAKKSIGDKDLDRQDLYIWIRRIWLQFFTWLKEKHLNTKVVEIGAFSFVENFKQTMHIVEKHYGKKLWTNYQFQDFSRNWLQYNAHEFQVLCQEISGTTKELVLSLPNVAFLKTHPCTGCREKCSCSFLKQKFFDKTSILHILQGYAEEQEDLFLRHVQNNLTMMPFSM